MDWIQTFSGAKFQPGAPRPEDFNIADIAHSLSLLCRFNGHCRRFYSVAEHSVRVSGHCPPRHALWGLLHDLGEAYLGDMPRPIKLGFPAFEEAELRLVRVACEVFGLPWPMPAEVKQADDALLATEMRDLMAPPPEDWKLREAPLAGRIEPWSAEEAELAFLARYRELTGAQ
jgi:5'-nucleotidase